MDRNYHGQYEQVKHRPRLSGLDCYHGLYMHEIESMKSARDYLLSYCSRSRRLIWNKIHISTKLPTGHNGDDFGAASSRFCYADVRNSTFDEDENKFFEDDTPYNTFAGDENEAPSESLHGTRDRMIDEINDRNFTSCIDSSPSYSFGFTHDVSENFSPVKLGNSSRFSSYSSGKTPSIFMNELNANISIHINSNRGARKAETAYMKSHDKRALTCLYDRPVQKPNVSDGFFHNINATDNKSSVSYNTDCALNSSKLLTNLNEPNGNNYQYNASLGHQNNPRATSFGCSPGQTNLYELLNNNNYGESVTSPTPCYGNKTSRNTSFGCSQMQTIWHEPNYNDNSFGYVETCSPSYNKSSYNTAFTDFTRSQLQTNMNQPCCDNSNVNYEGIPLFGYYSKKRSYGMAFSNSGWPPGQNKSNDNNPMSVL